MKCGRFQNIFNFVVFPWTSIVSLYATQEIYKFELSNVHVVDAHLDSLNAPKLINTKLNVCRTIREESYKKQLFIHFNKYRKLKWELKNTNYKQ